MGPCGWGCLSIGANSWVGPAAQIIRCGQTSLNISKLIISFLFIYFRSVFSCWNVSRFLWFVVFTDFVYAVLSFSHILSFANIGRKGERMEMQKEKKSLGCMCSFVKRKEKHRILNNVQVKVFRLFTIFCWYLLNTNQSDNYSRSLKYQQFNWPGRQISGGRFSVQ